MLAAAAESPSPSTMAALTRMTQVLDQERASRLAMEAVDLANAGEVEVGQFGSLADIPDLQSADHRRPESIAQTS